MSGYAMVTICPRYEGSDSTSSYPVMAVVNTTSPPVHPRAPMARPVRTTPSSRATRARTRASSANLHNYTHSRHKNTARDGPRGTAGAHCGRRDVAQGEGVENGSLRPGSRRDARNRPVRSAHHRSLPEIINGGTSRHVSAVAYCTPFSPSGKGQKGGPRPVPGDERSARAGRLRRTAPPAVPRQHHRAPLPFRQHRDGGEPGALRRGDDLGQALLHEAGSHEVPRGGEDGGHVGEQGEKGGSREVGQDEVGRARGGREPPPASHLDQAVHAVGAHVGAGAGHRHRVAVDGPHTRSGETGGGDGEDARARPHVDDPVPGLQVPPE